MPERETPELSEVFIIEAENMTCWQPEAFALTHTLAVTEMQKRRGIGRYQINFRVRKFVAEGL